MMFDDSVEGDNVVTAYGTYGIHDNEKTLCEQCQSCDILLLCV